MIFILDAVLKSTRYHENTGYDYFFLKNTLNVI